MRILISGLLLMSAICISAQTKLDKVLMVNGETKTGSVVGISDDAIEFIHEGEALKYKLKKADISKIEFGSGRIEVFNEVKGSTKDAMLIDHHNKIAVLPFTYILDGEQKKNDATERKVQQEFFSLMKDHVGILNVQPTTETNAILAKSGVNDENFIQFSMPEIANMLGVEYIIQATLSISKKGASSYNSSSLFVKQNQSKDKARGSSFSVNSTQIEYQTSLNMLLYNDNGDVVWSRTKEAFWPNKDAYKQTLKFLLKRMPIYTK
ncbi:hypothetical protein [Roseivirga misakiensis]|nr:hypothetical protein [Roseivirga misakiensis]